MNINPSISCVGSINFINSIRAIVLIPSFQSFPSIPSTPWSIVSLSPVPLIQSAPYSQYSLTSDSTIQYVLPKSQYLFNLFCLLKDSVASITKDFHIYDGHLWLENNKYDGHPSYIYDWHPEFNTCVRHTWWTFISFINDGHSSYSQMMDFHHIHI